MKSIITVLCLFLSFASLLAQNTDTAAQANPADTSYWQWGGLNSLTFSQVSFSEHWQAGGEPSVALNVLSNWFADYKRGRHTWENSLDLAYGLIRQGGTSKEFTKSDDRINLVTKYGYQMSKMNDMWYFSALLDFRSQFAEGFSDEAPDEVISRFMAPGYLLIGLGVDFKPNEALSFNYTPITGKFTFVLDDSLSAVGAYGVPEGDQVRAETGSFFRVKFKDEIMTNVNLDSRVELFTNYLEDFGVVDVNWQNALIMKINAFLTASFVTQLIYDRDILFVSEDTPEGEPAVQFKSVLGIGLSYQFGDKREEKQ